jgi:MFS family permease
MFATLSTAWVLPGVLGPAIAGAVGETFGWRYVFLGLLPLIAISSGIAYPQVRRVGPAAVVSDNAATLRLRLPLALMMATGTGLLLAGLTSGQPALLVGLGAIGAGLTVLALHRLTPPGTLRAARGLPAAVLVRGIITFAFFGVDAYIALLLVEWRGLSATQAGLTLTAATLTWTSGSWIQARLAPRFPPERFVQAGIAALIVGLSSFLLVLLPDVPTWLSVPTVGIAGLGMGLAYSPLALIVLREAHGAEQGRASSALSLTDSLGTALGIGITGAAVAASIRATDLPVSGLAVGFAVAIVVAVLGLILSTRLSVATRRERAVAALPAVDS